VALTFAGGYALRRRGLFRASLACVHVLAAGLVAFHFRGPLAEQLDAVFADGVLHGGEDLMGLLAAFGLAYGGLHWTTNRLAPTRLDYPPLLQRVGAVGFGLLAGYLAAGFLVCGLQTVPGLADAQADPDRPTAALRRALPPDRVWLALLRHASAHPFLAR
jgi:hypothetical protein